MLKYRVPSKSNPDKNYIVVDHTTFMECSCKSYHYRKECSHIKKVIKYLKDKYGKN